MDENTTTEHIKGVEVELTKVSIESNPNNQEEIKKITFETNKGNITWKPKVIRTRRVAGCEVKDKVAMQMEKMPENLKKLGTMAHNEGRVILLVNYTLMNTTMDGEPREFRFITSEKTFNDWKIIEEKTPEEVVE